MKRLILFISLINLCSILSAQDFENLVLEGGGIRGVAYVGALEVLEEKGLLSNIDRIGATSVGSITGALIAVGYTSDEILMILNEINVRMFNDGKAFFIGGSRRMSKFYGWYQGEKLRDWVDDLLAAKTGQKNLTFGQLHENLENNPKLKDLYVAVTNLSLQRPQILSYENFPNMKISDAVRISSGVPLYFMAVFMNEQGEVFYKPKKRQDLYIMSDGGFLLNYPINMFDEKTVGNDGLNSLSNNKTLGLRLERDEQIVSDVEGDASLVPYPIDNFSDYIGAFYNLVLESLNRSELTTEDWDRTVSISTCGIAPKVRKMRKEEIETLVQAGRLAMDNYLTEHKALKD